jgi:hypothetical protein
MKNNNFMPFWQSFRVAILKAKMKILTSSQRTFYKTFPFIDEFIKFHPSGFSKLKNNYLKNTILIPRILCRVSWRKNKQWFTIMETNMSWIEENRMKQREARTCTD